MPFGRKEALRPENPFKNPVGMPVVAPSNVIGKRRAKLAAEAGGVLVSIANLGDLKIKSSKWREIIKQRSLTYSFVGDMFIVPSDPLGRHGLNLLRFENHIAVHRS